MADYFALVVPRRTRGSSKNVQQQSIMEAVDPLRQHCKLESHKFYVHVC